MVFTSSLEFIQDLNFKLNIHTKDIFLPEYLLAIKNCSDIQLNSFWLPWYFGKIFEKKMNTHALSISVQSFNALRLKPLADSFMTHVEKANVFCKNM